MSTVSVTDVLSVVYQYISLPVMVQLCSTCTHMYAMLNSNDMVSLISHKYGPTPCTDFAGVVNKYVRSLDDPRISLTVLGEGEYRAIAIERNLPACLENILINDMMLCVVYAELCDSYRVINYIMQTMKPAVEAAAPLPLFSMKVLLRGVCAQARAIAHNEQYGLIGPVEDAIKDPAKRCLKIRSPKYARKMKDNIPDRKYLYTRSRDIYASYLLDLISYDELVRLNNEERARMRVVVRNAVVGL